MELLKSKEIILFGTWWKPTLDKRDLERQKNPKDFLYILKLLKKAFLSSWQNTNYCPACKEKKKHGRRGEASNRSTVN